MKRLLFVVFLVTTFAYGVEDYKVFETKNIDVSQVKSREVLFLGAYKEYQKKISEENKLFVSGAYGVTQGLSSTSGALAKGFYNTAGNGAATGLGIGIAIAGIQYLIDESEEERRFIKIEQAVMKDGQERILFKMVYLNYNHPKTDAEKALKILKGE